MKIRVGFVSNSSSSSFVLMVRKEAVDRLVPEDSWLHAFIDQHVNISKVFGIEVYVTGTMSDQGSNLWEYAKKTKFDGDIPDNDWGEKAETSDGIDMLAALIPEEDKFTYSMDM